MNALPESVVHLTAQIYNGQHAADFSSPSPGYLGNKERLSPKSTRALALNVAERSRVSASANDYTAADQAATTPESLLLHKKCTPSNSRLSFKNPYMPYFADADSITFANNGPCFPGKRRLLPTYSPHFFIFRLIFSSSPWLLPGEHLVG